MDEKEKANSETIDAEAETQSQSQTQSQSIYENQSQLYLPCQSGSVIENPEQAGAEFEDMNSAEVVWAVIYDFA